MGYVFGISIIAVSANLFADNIVASFPFFPRLHRFLSSRTNANPPVIITGVGPQGRAVVHYQAPAGMVANPPADDLIDPVLRNLGAPTPPSMDLETHPMPGSPLSQQPAPYLAGKENVAPVTTTKKSKAPAVSVLDLVENAKATIKKIPAKRTFEEMLCDLQRYDAILEYFISSSCLSLISSYSGIILQLRRNVLPLPLITNAVALRLRNATSSSNSTRLGSTPRKSLLRSCLFLTTHTLLAC